MSSRLEGILIFAVALVAIFALAAYLGFLVIAAGIAAAAPDGKTYEGFVSGTMQSAATILAGVLAIGAGLLAYRGARRQGELSLQAANETTQAMRELNAEQEKAQQLRFLTCLSIDLWSIAEQLEELSNGIDTLGAQPRAGQLVFLRTVWFEIPETITANWDEFVGVDPDIVGVVRTLALNLRSTQHFITMIEADLKAAAGIQFHDPFVGLKQSYANHVALARNCRTLLKERHQVEAPRPNPDAASAA